MAFAEHRSRCHLVDCRMWERQQVRPPLCQPGDWQLLAGVVVLAHAVLWPVGVLGQLGLPLVDCRMRERQQARLWRWQVGGGLEIGKWACSGHAECPIRECGANFPSSCSWLLFLNIPYCPPCTACTATCTAGAGCGRPGLRT
jgi:hypothetical protein